MMFRFVLLLLSWTEAALEYTGISYADSGVLKFRIENDMTSDTLRNIENNKTIFLDWLAPHHAPVFDIGNDVILVTNGSDAEYIKNQLVQSGAVVNDTNDIDAGIAAELNNPKRGRSIDEVGFHEVYHSWDEMEEFIQKFDAREDVTVNIIGVGHEGRRIYGVYIGKLYENPSIIVDCGIHAREWVSHAFCLYLMEELIDGAHQHWTEKLSWVIYPVLNPDGYAYSHNSQRLWRKNRNPNNGVPLHGCTWNTQGVDLNRNYDIKWMNTHPSNQHSSSQIPCKDTYAGTEPFSEPESFAHSQDMMTIPLRKAYLTYHSYGQIVLYPYSAEYKMEAHNKLELHELAKDYVKRLEAKHGSNWTYNEGAPGLGVAAGGSDDWSHSKGGVDISYTIEMMGSDLSGGFKLPEEDLLTSTEENMAGLGAVVDHLTMGAISVHLNLFLSIFLTYLYFDFL